MPGRRARYRGTRWPLLLPARAGPNRSDAYCQRNFEIYEFLRCCPSIDGSGTSSDDVGARWIFTAREAVEPTADPSGNFCFFFFTEIYQTSRLLLILKSKTQSNMGPNKKRKLANQPEEINFDPDARQQFLTGFRKRKLQRVKHAQEVAEKRAREERIEYRKRVRSFLVEEW